MKHRLLTTLEFVLSEQGADEIPICFVHEKIRKQRYCGEVSESDLVDLLKELIDQDLFEASCDDAGEITGSSLVWKSGEHPSIENTDSKPILL